MLASLVEGDSFSIDMRHKRWVSSANNKNCNSLPPTFLPSPKIGPKSIFSVAGCPATAEQMQGEGARGQRRRGGLARKTMFNNVFDKFLML